jgi:hypothetical protein
MIERMTALLPAERQQLSRNIVPRYQINQLVIKTLKSLNEEKYGILTFNEHYSTNGEIPLNFE